MSSEDNDERRSQRAADDQIPDIYELIEREGVKSARAKYAKIFGRPHNAKCIDKEIEERFLAWLSPDFDVVINKDGSLVGIKPPTPPPPLRVPAHLVLALILREGFAGRSRGQSPSACRVIMEERTHKRYLKLKAEFKAELIAKGKLESYAANIAEVMAADTISHFSGLSKEKVRRPNRRWKESAEPAAPEEVPGGNRE